MPLILGTAQWGQRYGIANTAGQPPLEEIGRILAVARAAGIRALDTARAYGRSEALIGAATQGDRHFSITTKLDPALGSASDEKASRQGVRDRVARSLAASRRALARADLDVVLLHRASQLGAADGLIWRVLEERRTAGEVGRIGVSANTPAEAWACVADPRVEVVQVAANLLDRRLVDSGFFAVARTRGVEVNVRSVYLQGVAHLEVIPQRFSPAAGVRARSAPRPRAAWLRAAIRRSPTDRAALPQHLSGLAPVLARIDRWACAHQLSRSEVFLAYASRALGAPLVLGCETTGQLLSNLVAWRSIRFPGKELLELAGSLGSIDAALLEPSRWSENARWAAPTPARRPLPPEGSRGRAASTAV